MYIRGTKGNANRKEMKRENKEGKRRGKRERKRIDQKRGSLFSSPAHSVSVSGCLTGGLEGEKTEQDRTGEAEEIRSPEGVKIRS